MRLAGLIILVSGTTSNSPTRLPRHFPSLIRILFLICKFGSNSFSSRSILVEMPPKLSSEQIDDRLVEMRDYVQAHLPHLAARSDISLKATFVAKREEKDTVFYNFLYKHNARFTEVNEVMRMRRSHF